MPAIEITEDQHEYLTDLRAELAEEHVGAYGTVRPRDALQFLIDRHEEAGATDAAEDAAADDEDDGEDADDDGADRLQAMMNLLDEHDDKWEQTDADEGRYAVTLPDGETETVRTRDDVRALLFRHYG